MLVCDDCGENFLTLRERRNHTIRAHVGVRQHLCSFCGSNFYTDSGKVLSNLHTYKDTIGKGSICFAEPINFY